MDTNMFDAWELAKQINGTSISYVIVSLSSGASGDRYISPHPVLTNLSRGVTPKNVGDGFPLCRRTSGCVPPNPNNGVNQPTYNPNLTNFSFEQYKDKDLFEQLLDAMDSINVNVIAYMAAQGPPMLKAGESKVFDYPQYRNGFLTGGYLVDSVQECQTRWNVTSGNCSPSARRWVEWVVKEYCTQTPKADCKGKFTTAAAGYNFDDVYINGTDLSNAVKEAYAEVIVDYYAKKHTRIRGFWFDQAHDDIINRAKITAAVRRHIPNAAIALNNGYLIPLRNNNPDSPLGEDYTGGHMKPIRGGPNPVDGSYNFGLILSVEKSINGFVYPNPKFNVFGNENDLSGDRIPSNPYLENAFGIKYTKQAGKASLAHVFFPTSDYWNGGGLVWNLRQATEWMQRVLDANGAWTWNVKRTKWNVDDISNNPATIASEDMDFIQQVFAGLKGGTNPIMGPYQFNGHNCDSIDPNVPCECLSHSGTTTGWGCAEDVTEPDKPVPVCVDDLNANEELWFVDVGFGKKKYCHNTDWFHQRLELRCGMVDSLDEITEANNACCVCGGGTVQSDHVISTEPVIEPVPGCADGLNKNEEPWSVDAGLGRKKYCNNTDWFQLNLEFRCGMVDSFDGITEASDACCVCGGGSTVQSDGPSFSPPGKV